MIVGYNLIVTIIYMKGISLKLLGVVTSVLYTFTFFII